MKFESAYQARSKVLEAREEENSLQVELIAKLQEKIKVCISNKSNLIAKGTEMLMFQSDAPTFIYTI